MAGEFKQPVPFSLRDAPALIERVFPAQKVSAEAQKERKANAGQTLTALGSYWKGRKPLILVRACILGALLPATDDPEADLAIFEKLMAVDDASFIHRVKRRNDWPGVLAKPYLERLNSSYRPEELSEDIYEGIWDEVNRHLGTSAHSISSLVDELGVMRFGRRPSVADTFAGGGSIPFEAARLGCDVYAADLNPIACMLTWGALHLLCADEATRAAVLERQRRLADEVDAEITALGVEHDSAGNRAKAFLYCLEVRCPKTGWLVPLSGSWIVSHSRATIARLRPDPISKRFEIDVVAGVSAAEIEAARFGTAVGGDLAYVLDGIEYRTPLATIRGDRPDGSNSLRQWELSDIAPQLDDVFGERLYAIQWVSRPGGDEQVFFTGVREEDLEREKLVRNHVLAHLYEWQTAGWVPDMEITPGAKTDEPMRTRGWRYWHHLFTPRDLLVFSLWKRRCSEPADYILLALLLDLSSRLSRWLTSPPGKSGGPRDLPCQVFYNQALNTFYNYAVRSAWFHRKTATGRSLTSSAPSVGVAEVSTGSAAEIGVISDIFVTDPPYADAVVYDEITEYFISWLRRSPPEEFSEWIWDSRRSLAIRGEGEQFRARMVASYAAMANHMPDNGLQIVMFTHQSGEVWADMAQIFWGAGLQVMAAWYIATETTSELKKGGYVQGTVILVLRKRKSDEAGYRDEIVQEIKVEVARQIETMVGLNQSLKGHGRIENLFEDADLQMAGYAAALRVLTGYARIDGTDMTREALRPRQKGERSLVSDIVDFAVQVANEHLVPEGMNARVWERLNGSERFYLKMLDVETTGAKKLDNYQNFAKAFRVPDYTELMHRLKPNDARLRNAVQFHKGGFEGTEFGRSPTRAALFALQELQTDADGDVVLGHLRDLVDGYHGQRETLIAVTAYIASKREGVDDEEAKAARILHGLIRNERLGA
ncbi:MAG: anti-phage-associated DUF1156 domain-containing protein [Myxococcota bacterium]